MISAEIVVTKSVTGVFLGIHTLHLWSINIYCGRRIFSMSTIFLKTLFTVYKIRRDTGKSKIFLASRFIMYTLIILKNICQSCEFFHKYAPISSRHLCAFYHIDLCKEPQTSI